MSLFSSAPSLIFYKKDGKILQKYYDKILLNEGIFDNVSDKKIITQYFQTEHPTEGQKKALELIRFLIQKEFQKIETKEKKSIVFKLPKKSKDSQFLIAFFKTYFSVITSSNEKGSEEQNKNPQVEAKHYNYSNLTQPDFFENIKQIITTEIKKEEQKAKNIDEKGNASFIEKMKFSPDTPEEVKQNVYQNILDLLRRYNFKYQKKNIFSKNVQFIFQYEPEEKEIKNLSNEIGNQILIALDYDSIDLFYKKDKKSEIKNLTSIFFTDSKIENDMQNFEKEIKNKIQEFSEIIKSKKNSFLNTSDDDDEEQENLRLKKKIHNIKEKIRNLLESRKKIQDKLEDLHEKLLNNRGYFLGLGRADKRRGLTIKIDNLKIKKRKMEKKIKSLYKKIKNIQEKNNIKEDLLGDLNLSDLKDQYKREFDLDDFGFLNDDNFETDFFKNTRISSTISAPEKRRILEIIDEKIKSKESLQDTHKRIKQKFGITDREFLKLLSIYLNRNEDQLPESVQQTILKYIKRNRY